MEVARLEPTRVEPLRGLHYNVKLLVLFRNIRLLWRAGTYQSGAPYETLSNGRLRALPTIIRLGWK
jgi:hypothetical protein